MKQILILCTIVLMMASFADAQQRLRYVPGPPDNPLKGLVPYARPHAERFPHSMEFNYLPLSDLMVGENKFDWQPLESLLNDIASRRKQTVFRIWMEYPGHDNGIPKFLEEAGVKVTEWMNTNTAPFPPTKVRTPDYSNPKVRKALQDFISALGKRYDGDPRIGFITAGLLGTWGEWHTYPRNDLMAKKEVQNEVMAAFEDVFERTPILLRYPAGKNNHQYAANDGRAFGYHDDSFAWATIDTGRKEDSWFFMPAMKAAGASEKWKQYPIGGEVRPEIWAKIFDKELPHEHAQDFATCVRQTHATWLMETGMFKDKQPHERVERAIEQVRQMGYDLHISSIKSNRTGNDAEFEIQVQNRGVAPFYYDWKVELGIFDANKNAQKTFETDFSVQGILPNETRRWLGSIPDLGDRTAGVRVVNPLGNGLPLLFANEEKLQLGDGWLRISGSND